MEEILLHSRDSPEWRSLQNGGDNLLHSHSPAFVRESIFDVIFVTGLLSLTPKKLEESSRSFHGRVMLSRGLELFVHYEAETVCNSSPTSRRTEWYASLREIQSVRASNLVKNMA